MLFARYAFPPNQHGYCGPSDAAGFLSHGAAGNDPGLREMARDFDGALPYLDLIAHSLGRTDPLDPAVVEAYWLGGAGLEGVRSEDLTPEIEASMRHRTGPLFATMADALAAGALPHHSFAVFCVYPWVAMLGDERRTPQALKVLDRCRIRWGQVISVEDDEVVAEVQPLIWADAQLRLGRPAAERVRRTVDGVGLSSPLTAGDWVALHWEWVCDRISDAQRGDLDAASARHLDLANARVGRRLLGAGRRHG